MLWTSFLVARILAGIWASSLGQGTMEKNMICKLFLRPLEAELEAKIGQSTLPFWEKKRAKFEKSWSTFLGSPKSDSPRFGFGPFPEDDKCH